MPIELLRYIPIDIENIHPLVAPRHAIDVFGIEGKLQRIGPRDGLSAAAGVGGTGEVFEGGYEVVLRGGVGGLAEAEVGVDFGAVRGAGGAAGAGLEGFGLAGGFLEDLEEGGGGFEVGVVCAVGAGVQGRGGGRKGVGEGEELCEEEEGEGRCGWGDHCGLKCWNDWERGFSCCMRALWGGFS